MQLKRFHRRRHDPLRRWKITDIDLAAIAKWDDYTKAKEDMFRFTHTAASPWTVIRANDKRRTRLEAIRCVLYALDYEGKDAAVVDKPTSTSSARDRTFSTARARHDGTSAHSGRGLRAKADKLRERHEGRGLMLRARKNGRGEPRAGMGADGKKISVLSKLHTGSAVFRRARTIIRRNDSASSDHCLSARSTSRLRTLAPSPRPRRWVEPKQKEATRHQEKGINCNGRLSPADIFSAAALASLASLEMVHQGGADDGPRDGPAAARRRNGRRPAARSPDAAARPSKACRSTTRSGSARAPRWCR
jgi:hypothetical protein